MGKYLPTILFNFILGFVTPIALFFIDIFINGFINGSTSSAIQEGYIVLIVFVVIFIAGEMIIYKLSKNIVTYKYVNATCFSFFVGVVLFIMNFLLF